jgi:predicted AlkP superfamily pyrophosphatase or phosphodiesterase
MLAAIFLGLPAAFPAQFVIQISVDGLRGDLMSGYVSASPETFPNIIRLMTEGSHTYNARCDYELSESVPNHTTMFTGRPVRNSTSGLATWSSPWVRRRGSSSFVRFSTRDTHAGRDIQ